MSFSYWNKQRLIFYDGYPTRNELINDKQEHIYQSLKIRSFMPTTLTAKLFF